jgi:hypothetical protein
MKENLIVRNKIIKIKEIKCLNIKEEMKIHNHFCNNFIIGNKKALFKTMFEYYSFIKEEIFNYLPLTFHIKNGLEDDEYLKFLQYYYAISKKNKGEKD